jgi:hypothetical protein
MVPSPAACATLGRPWPLHQVSNWCSLFFQRRGVRLKARNQAADFAWKILTNLASCQVRQNGERPPHFGDLKNLSFIINKIRQI